MRFLHTSDWHLGRTLHGVDLIDAQRAVLDQVVQLVAEPPDGIAIDAVLVAGDIYDRAVPPVEAVSLCADVLAALTEHTRVVISSGNHDSAIRLGFGARLFTDRLHVRTQVGSLSAPILLEDAAGTVAVYALPYLDPDSCRLTLSTDGQPLARSHQAVMSAAMDRVRADLAGRAGARSVLLAHAFVVGGEPSDSERSIVVGGVDSVAADTFAGIDYVALGHLHGAQQPRTQTETVLAYSGSPLRYSFSELSHQKSITLVDLDPDGSVHLQRLPLTQPREMADLVGTIDELLAGRSHTHDWVRVTVTDRARPDQPFERLKARYPHLLNVRFAPQGAEPAAATSGAGAATHRSPRQLGVDFVQHVTGVTASEDELELFERAYAEALSEAGTG